MYIINSFNKIMREYKLEKTCRCINEYVYVDDVLLSFHKGREYQVDVLSVYENGQKLLYKVYQNGGWYDYAILTQEEFDKNFEIIV